MDFHDEAELLVHLIPFGIAHGHGGGKDAVVQFLVLEIFLQCCEILSEALSVCEGILREKVWDGLWETLLQARSRGFINGHEGDDDDRRQHVLGALRAVDGGSREEGGVIGVVWGDPGGIGATSAGGVIRDLRRDDEGDDVFCDRT